MAGVVIPHLAVCLAGCIVRSVRYSLYCKRSVVLRLKSEFRSTLEIVLFVHFKVQSRVFNLKNHQHHAQVVSSGFSFSQKALVQKKREVGGESFGSCATP